MCPVCCTAEPCFWHFCQSINTGALSAEIQDTQITLSLLHLTWEPSTHINSYRPALYNDENNSKFLGKRKAYICGWIYPEYSLARTCSVFRFQHKKSIESNLWVRENDHEADHPVIHWMTPFLDQLGGWLSSSGVWQTQISCRTTYKVFQVPYRALRSCTKHSHAFQRMEHSSGTWLACQCAIY